jgi:hypothetical protein
LFAEKEGEELAREADDSVGEYNEMIKICRKSSLALPSIQSVFHSFIQPLKEKLQASIYF